MSAARMEAARAWSAVIRCEGTPPRRPPVPWRPAAAARRRRSCSAAASSPAASWSSRPRQCSVLACRCGVWDPAARSAAWPARVCAVRRSLVASARRTASGSRSSISSSSLVFSANAAVSAASASAGAPACSRSRLRASASGPITWLPIRLACGAAAARVPACGGQLAAMEADHRGDAQVAARRHWHLRLVVQGFHLGHCLGPAAGVEKQLTQGAMRLDLPEHRADLISEVERLAGRGQCLLVPVQVAQGDGQVDQEQHPQVGQRRVSLGDGQCPLEQRQRIGHLPLHPGHDRQHVQCPAHRPVVARLRRHRQRGRGDPA